MSENLGQLVDFSNFLADEARKTSLKFFKNKFNIKSKDKKYFDPVTIADLKIQRDLNKIINKKYPNHSVLGEEASIKNTSIFEWCIDPIDGTKSFIQGFPVWGTLISLSKNNEIILGLADIPALDERYIGYSNKSYKINKGKKSKLRAGKTLKLKDSILNTTSPYVFANKHDHKIFEKIVNKVKTVRLGGDCYSYCLLADGYVDIVIESGLKPWDIRALEPIIKNAGGELKTWEGKKIFNGGRIVASANNQLFKKVKTILLKKKPRHK